jgi:cytochrome c oxidase subunit 3
LWCGSLNFFILLTSSQTIVLAINAAAQDERPNRMIRWLVVTLVLGAAFLGVKGYEYYLDFQDKVVPILDSEVKPGEGSAGELFWIFYWVATALHAIHLTIGIGLVLHAVRQGGSNGAVGWEGEAGAALSSLRTGILIHQDYASQGRANGKCRGQRTHEKPDRQTPLTFKLNREGRIEI